MKPSESVQLKVRGINYHCRCWGREGAPKLFMLHGFQDVSASWQFTVDALEKDWHVIAPDWRGYGLTGWSGQDTYWFPDFIADLDAILDHFEPQLPARLVAHSMGASVAGLYAGAVGKRVSKLVSIEGFGGAPAIPEEAPRRYAKWLRQIAQGEEQRPYADFEDFALRMMAENPRLSAERAKFLVQHWGKEEADGTVVRRADPAHKVLRPTPARQDEALACWRAISAPVLMIEGANSRHVATQRAKPEEHQERLAAFQTLVDVVRIDNAGHNIHHDQPAALAQAIEPFLLAP
ncbi:MAG: alpha/beta hydrolase [Betaproteobacteria bacterium]|nr:alpha/beta hydrolase [Betaproteobacteria bacterium]